MMTRKKRILIILILLLAIVGIFSGLYALLFFKTDLLKSDRDLFYTYLGKNIDILDVVDDEWIAKYEERTKNTKYDNEGQISFEISDENDGSDLNKLINNGKIQFKGVTDTVNKKAFQDIKLMYSNEEEEKELFNLKFLKEQDLYGLKSDEVVIKYISIENNDIYELLNRLGKSNTYNIANKIEKYDINRILNMSEETKEEIIQKYMDVLKEQIPSNKFTKEKDIIINRNDQEYTTNKYTLKLTGDEEINIKVKLLETLLNDENILQEVNKIQQKNDENITVLKTKIQDQINDIKRQPSNSNIIFELSVYEVEGELIRTELIKPELTLRIENVNTKNNQTVTITNTETSNGTIVTTYKLNRQTFTNISQISLEYNVTENSRQATNILINIKNEIKTGDEIDTTIEAEIEDDLGNKKIQYNNLKKFNTSSEIESLRDDTVILNNMTLDYNRSTIEAIKERLDSIFKQRMEENDLDPESIKHDWELALKKYKEKFNRDEFEKQIQRSLNYIKQDALVDAEYIQELEKAKTEEEKRLVKQRKLVQRLIEFGMDASMDEEEGKVYIDSGYDYNYVYYIDYDNYTVTRSE